MSFGHEIGKWEALCEKYHMKSQEQEMREMG